MQQGDVYIGMKAVARRLKGSHQTVETLLAALRAGTLTAYVRMPNEEQYALSLRYWNDLDPMWCKHYVP